MCLVVFHFLIFNKILFYIFCFIYFVLYILFYIFCFIYFVLYILFNFKHGANSITERLVLYNICIYHVCVKYYGKCIF